MSASATSVPQVGSGKAPKGKVGAKASQASWIVKTVVWIIVFLWTLPTIGLLVTSFRPTTAQFNGWWNVITNPTQLTIQNYQDALTTGSNPMGGAFLNSLAVAIPATIIPILIAAFAAYAFTFMDFPGKNVLFIVIVGLSSSPTRPPLSRCSGCSTSSTSMAPSSRCGWSTSGSVCRWRSTSCATTWAPCPRPSSSRRRSTARATSRPSGSSSSR